MPNITTPKQTKLNMAFRNGQRYSCRSSKIGTWQLEMAPRNVPITYWFVTPFCMSPGRLHKKAHSIVYVILSYSFPCFVKYVASVRVFRNYALMMLSSTIKMRRDNRIMSSSTYPHPYKRKEISFAMLQRRVQFVGQNDLDPESCCWIVDSVGSLLKSFLYLVIEDVSYQR